mmetsp:Transcript_13574/g.40230  ORF Transcript_13574/g.40230 Transcript_13574/m.40230 type:complete len:326 (-) Transcript_13574:75-1052(-)|eukprot:CAMPEP_0118872294 /NCGR_PEP_ID=MMETSP1163-20130328/14537_1 /TAXON_ID=124430 /ORGANISM="Phaeomonas parva, Strain CCMP2877" /LENGTH=325 /DNA_ID=CAMNT_0006807465 /DNA_START=94 /DNA_END=1071 /DNA_ORIENTATION=+
MRVLAVLCVCALALQEAAALRPMLRPRRIGKVAAAGARKLKLEPRLKRAAEVAANSRAGKAGAVAGLALLGKAKGAAASSLGGELSPGVQMAKTIFNYSAGALAAYALWTTYQQRFKVKGSLESNEVQLAFMVDWERDNIVDSLNAIAETADVSTDEGLAAVVSDAAKAMLKHRGDWVLGLPAKRRFIGASTQGGAEAAFDRRLANERKRWEPSTRGTFNGEVIEEGAADAKGLKPISEGTTYAVVSILILWDGVNGGSMPIPEEDEAKNDVLNQVEEALQALARNVPEKDRALRAAEILWTPEEKDDVLGADEVATKWGRLLPL